MRANGRHRVPVAKRMSAVKGGRLKSSSAANPKFARVLSIPKFAQSSLQMLANFGIGTLAHIPAKWPPVRR
jgi:hypothetical protein